MAASNTFSDTEQGPDTAVLSDDGLTRAGNLDGLLEDFNTTDDVDPAEAGLTVRDLKVFYGAVPAVRGVSFACRPGQVVGMIGPNGAGKTSLLSGVAGIIRASGSVHFDGHDVSRWPAYRRGQAGMVMVADRRRVFPSLSLRENLLVSGWGMGRAELEERVTKVLELFPQLKARQDVPPAKLSGGEQRMLSIGRALVTGARCILFDELSLGLAPRAVKTMAEAARQLADSGRMVVLVEQYIGVLLDVADEVHVLERGRSVFGGPPAETVMWLRENGYLNEPSADVGVHVARPGDLTTDAAWAPPEEEPESVPVPVKRTRARTNGEAQR